MKIDKNIPLLNNNQNTPSKYILPEMEIGDSILFTVPENERFNAFKQRTIAGLKHHNPDYVLSLRNEGKNSFRVWRVAEKPKNVFVVINKEMIEKIN
jgi:hypothetical protein